MESVTFTAFNGFRDSEYPVIVHGFDPTSKVLDMQIGHVRRQIDLRVLMSDHTLSAAYLAVREFEEIEHPIRDDLQKSHSVVRDVLKRVLNPHGIKVDSSS